MYNNDFIILTTTGDSVFKISEISLKNIIIESIKPEAVFLFKEIKTIELNYWANFELPEIIQTIRHFLDACSSIQHISLKVSANQVSSLTSSIFDGISNFRKLYLGGNEIVSVEPSIFKADYFENLRELKLNENKLNFIHANTFEGLGNLQILNLNNKFLRSIEISTFNGLSSLQHLFMNKNLINKIQPFAFSSLTNLKTLFLNSNKLDSISFSTFNGLENLEALWLQENKINSVDPFTFTSLKNLQTLYLHDNRINSIESFFELASLKKLKEL